MLSTGNRGLPSFTRTQRPECFLQWGLMEWWSEKFKFWLCPTCEGHPDSATLLAYPDASTVAQEIAKAIDCPHIKVIPNVYLMYVYFT